MPENNENIESNPILETADQIHKSQPIESGVDRIIEAIEQNANQFSVNSDEKNFLKNAVSLVLQDIFQDMSHTKSSSDLDSLAMGLVNIPSQVNKQPDTSAAMGLVTPIDTTNAAVDAAARGADKVGTSFVSFTQGLITGTFTAIVQSAIQQMKAYTEMVAELTKSLKEFASDNINEQAVNDKLNELSFVDGSDSFAIKKDGLKRLNHLRKLYALAPSIGGHKDEILKIFSPISSENLKNETIQDATSKNVVSLDSVDLNKGITGIASPKYTDAEIVTIKEVVKMSLAKEGLNQLRMMARDGMTRIVITEGEIHTKLTFSVKSDASSTTDSKKDETTNAGVSASVSGKGSWGWGSASASLSGHYDSLSVNTIDEKTISSITTATDMLGEVTLKFKTDYLPLEGSNGGKVDTSKIV